LKENWRIIFNWGKSTENPTSKDAWNLLLSESFHLYFIQEVLKQLVEFLTESIEKALNYFQDLSSGSSAILFSSVAWLSFFLIQNSL
jgi:hypothetical protein